MFWILLKDSMSLTTFEFDLDLLPFWFAEEGFSFVCFFSLPVTTSNTVGTSFIMLNKRFLN